MAAPRAMARPQATLEPQAMAAPRTAPEPRVTETEGPRLRALLGPRAAPEPRALLGTGESSRLLVASSTAAWSETAICTAGATTTSANLGTPTRSIAPCHCRCGSLGSRPLPPVAVTPAWVSMVG